MVVAAVVDFHCRRHGDDSTGCPSHLPEQEEIARAVAFFRHDCGGAEYHHQPKKYQDQSDREQPTIDAYTFCHRTFISSRGLKGKQENVCEFLETCNYLGS